MQHYNVVAHLRSILSLSLLASCLAACSGGGAQSTLVSALPTAGADVSASARQASDSAASVTPIHRAHFLGAFFRSMGAVPFGVFSTTSPQKAPRPYPSPTGVLFGPSGYCDEVAANNVSISTGYQVDPTKLANVVNLGVKWTRSTVSSLFDDQSHVFGPGSFNFADSDSMQCALLRNSVTPVIGLEAGPVQYNSIPGTFSPAQVTTYKTPADFASYCGAVAAHEASTFSAVTKYSIPGNEVNTNPGLFPGGIPQIAAYSKACYAAIKAAQPNSFVYGLELNMDGSLNTPNYVAQLVAIGCGMGTCYDGLSIHLSLTNPMPASSAPCFPAAKGTYSMACVTSIREASGHRWLHILIGETVYTVPGSVADEATKASAIVAEMKTMATDFKIDGVSYANVDECAVYPSGFFFDGCLVDQSGNELPAYSALKALATKSYN